MRYAYNTNGLQSHRLEHALQLLAEHGYDGVALTLDWGHLDPLDPWVLKRAIVLRTQLEDLGLSSVIETGARFLLDPRRKHEPTLVTPEEAGRERRIEFLCTAVDIAHVLGSEAVCFFAGVSHDGDPQARDWLLHGIDRVRAHAERKDVTVALEPEPGHVVASLDDVGWLPEDLPLALDVGHCLVTQEIEPDEAIRRFAHRAATITVEDMPRGVHEHRPFGEGDLDLAATAQALHDVAYEGLVCVELSRESHRAHETVPGSIAALREAAAEAVRS